MMGRIRQRIGAEGFTLIELLIVIVILGILAGIVVFSVSAISDRGNVAACKADVKAVEVAVESYRAKMGKYPDAGTSDLRFDQVTTDDIPNGKAKFLRSKPVATNGYTITIIDTSGGVTVAPAGCVIP